MDLPLRLTVEARGLTVSVTCGVLTFNEIWMHLWNGILFSNAS